MWIDKMNFTPLESLIGGVLIGFAAMILILYCGRVMGISGIMGGILKRQKDYAWRWLFLMGVFSAPWFYQLFTGAMPEITLETPWWLVIIAGLLVGFGTRLGSGCTSGHGVCGLSRFSLRSLVSTLIFMVIAMATVMVVNLF